MCSETDVQVEVARRLVAQAFLGDMDAQSPINFEALYAKAVTADQIAALQLAQTILRGGFDAVSPSGAQVILASIHEALAA